MFSRGIRGISIDNNISAVAVKEKDDFSPTSLSRRLFSTDAPPVTVLVTPMGEMLTLTSSNEKTELSKLTVYGVCMNTTGAKIYKTISGANINVLCTSLCDIAASFVIASNEIESAVKLIKNDFTLEV